MRSNEESVETKLQRIALKASKDKDCQFTRLFHLMNEELLLECFTCQQRSKTEPLKELEPQLSNRPLSQYPFKLMAH